MQNRPDDMRVKVRKHDSNAGASAQWVSRSSGTEFRAHRVRLAQVSGVGEIPTMRNVWVIYIIAILAFVLAAAWIIFVQPHLHLHHV